MQFWTQLLVTFIALVIPSSLFVSGQNSLGSSRTSNPTTSGVFTDTLGGVGEDVDELLENVGGNLGGTLTTVQDDVNALTKALGLNLKIGGLDSTVTGLTNNLGSTIKKTSSGLGQTLDAVLGTDNKQESTVAGAARGSVGNGVVDASGRATGTTVGVAPAGNAVGGAAGVGSNIIPGPMTASNNAAGVGANRPPGTVPASNNAAGNVRRNNNPDRGNRVITIFES